MKQLQDTDKMPSLHPHKDVGKHQGEFMQDIPASYFHYLWTNGKEREVKTCPVADYISRNLGALKQEYKNGIWD